MVDKIDVSKTVPLYNIKDNAIKYVPIENAIKYLYKQTDRIPTDTELKQFDINETANDIRTKISMNDSYIPLYDAYTQFIYLIQKRNVYRRVVDHNYRFPDDLIVISIINSKKKMVKQINKHPELKNDILFARSYQKTLGMVAFMSQFDINILYNTYLSVFYKYSPEIGNNTFTCLRKSFIPHKKHLTPYYTKDEALKLSMNLGIITQDNNQSYVDFKDKLTNDDFRRICKDIQTYDVSAEILIQHQNYIVENNLVGLVQYYTQQGSYFMNQYLRGMTKYEYRNDYLEENIIKIWELVLNAPQFDNGYILYRFVSTDEYLKHLQIGDVYQDLGFMSTTRDPFYRNDLYKFGFILIKIYVPKKIKGVGLCLETLSHFPEEEEVILPPLTKLKLISKNEDCNYYHPDETFVTNVKTRYEFEWIGNTKVTLPIRPNLPLSMATQVIDFLEIKNIKTMSIKEKIDFIMKTYFDPMNRILCKIGNNTFYVVGEWYDSTGAYHDMYSLKISDGFSLYSIYKGYILFMIEIGDYNGEPNIRINYYTKYSRHNRHELLGDDNFVKFISSIAYYFEIPNVIMYADYMSCDPLTNKNRLQSRAQSQIKSDLDIFDTLHNKQLETTSNTKCKCRNVGSLRGGQKKQRTFGQKSQNALNLEDTNTKDKDLSNEDKNKDYELKEIENEYDGDMFTGGSYCFDFYQYFKHGIKRYHDSDVLMVELQPVFSYDDLDILKHSKPTTILNSTDRDEIYQFYVKNYLPEINNDHRHSKLADFYIRMVDNDHKHNNLADFYIWMIENKCYLMDIFIVKMDRLYWKNNPFKKAMYNLDAMAYLYNRKYVLTYNRFIKMVVDEEHQILDIPKNEYRIVR